MKSINDFLEAQVNENQTPSIQYILFDTVDIIYQKRYGVRSVKEEWPLEADTHYHLYSITKTFTALSVLQLVQDGKVELNAQISAYLPKFPYSGRITIDQLLSHTSGIPNPLPLRWIHLPSEHSAFDRDSFFSTIFSSHSKLGFEPGTEFKYSNLGYVFLGQLVEKVSGMSLEEYITQNIFCRCGVREAELSFDLDSSNHAVGYQKQWSLINGILGFMIDKPKFMGNPEGKWKPFKYFYNNGTAYGGMFGSAPGLMAYAQTLLVANSPLLDDFHKQLLFTEKSIEGKGTGMSMSWFTGSLKGNRYLTHAGGGGGYYVELRVYPDLGIGSLIMYNRSGMTDERILDRTDSFFITELTRVNTTL